jgi:flagellar biosynthesis protein FlhA
MDVGDAARTYTLLTIGDGLVTQVPALIVSTAAGMLVTRSTASSNLGADLTGQLFVQPKAIATASAILFIFGLIPGMPKISFMIISLLSGLLAFNLFRFAKRTEAIKEKVPAVAPKESVERLLALDLMELEVGYGLIPLVDAAQGGELLQRIKSLRKQLALDMGFIIPAIHIRDNLQLKPNEYSFLLKGVEIARGELMPGYFLTIAPEDRGAIIKGIETKEPAFGLPAFWVSEKEKENIQARGLIVVDCATVTTTHLTEIIKSHADELLGREEVRALLDNLALGHPKVVEELVPNVIPLGTVQKVLQRLLRERISIRDLLTILDTLADYLPVTKNVDLLTSYVRQALARTISKQYKDDRGNISVVIVSPEIEDHINNAIQHTEYESYLVADPNLIQRIVNSLQRFVTTFTTRGLQPIVLCSPKTRIHLRKVLERFFPNIIILSHNEITHDVNINSLGMVEL